MAKFKKGDVLEVIAYDQGDEEWEFGTILITDHNPTSAHTTEGCYGIQPLKGTVKWIRVNSKIFDDGVDIPIPGNLPVYPSDIYRTLITNIGDSKNIDILFGKNETSSD